MEARTLSWDLGKARHLLNRVSFGARSVEIEQAHALGAQACVEHLLAESPPWSFVPPYLARWEEHGMTLLQEQLPGTPFEKMSPDEKYSKCQVTKVQDRDPFLALQQQWFESIVDHADPLRDKMTLFWHGFFTTSRTKVGRWFEVIRQFQWMRENALGSYATLLRGIVRDPAMLLYLDNAQNYAHEPNENFARELMELYSLGEGHYSERDVREAARALTGHFPTLDGVFELDESQHDGGRKTILGTTAKHTADSLAELLLRQRACPRWIAMRLLRWFEGPEPAAGRVEHYARILKKADFELVPFLRELFLDDEFYRPGVRGARVLGPIEFLCGMCRKLGVAAPSPFYHFAAGYLGQELYEPPNVSGWPHGLEWITNDALTRRGNVAGVVTGALGAWEDFERDFGEYEQVMARTENEHVLTPRRVFLLRRRLGEHQWDAGAYVEALKRDGVRDDRALVARWCADWLWIEPPAETRIFLLQYLAAERLRVGAPPAWVESEHAERFVRNAAQLVFSLPEAQLA